MYLINRSIRVGFIVLLITLFSVGIAGASPKIGFVDIGKIIDESAAGQEADGLLQAFVAERQQVLDELELEIEQLNEQLEASEDEGEQDALQADIDEKTAALGQQLQTFENEINAVIEDFRGQILSDIQVVLELFGEEHGFDVIFDTGSVAYIGDVVDVTDDVIAKYDEMLADSRALEAGDDEADTED